MADYETILSEQDDGILTITMNRPDKLNAANDTLLGELISAFKGASRDDSVRAVVLTGAGRGFCAGADLGGVSERGESGSFDYGTHLRKTFNPLIRSMTSLPKPIIGGINGVAAGAGMSMAVACDYIIAGESASFLQAFVNIGLVPDSASTWVLPRLVGVQRAMDLMLTGRKIDSATAFDWGLVNQVVPDDDLQATVAETAARFAAAPTKAIGYIKRAVAYGYTHTLAESLEYEADMQDLAGRTDDHKGGRSRFPRKTPPRRSKDNKMAQNITAVKTIGVVGAGTMGAGIAQIAAQSGFGAVLFDIDPGVLGTAQAQIARFINRAAEKGRISAEEATAAIGRVTGTSDMSNFGVCQIVIEAVPERMDLKHQILTELEGIVANNAILATNTSTLSITQIASAVEHPWRVVGMHFFNPAPLMPLVEVIAGTETTTSVIDATIALARSLGKTPVQAKDTPGFIVNRVARPFYLEALRMVESGVADHETIDHIIKEGGGFRMGPFELMDLIGVDVNYAASRSVYEAYFGEARFRPNLLQQRAVDSGRLGRKTGQGWYRYDEGGDA